MRGILIVLLYLFLFLSCTEDKTVKRIKERDIAIGDIVEIYAYAGFHLENGRVLDINPKGYYVGYFNKNREYCESYIPKDRLVLYKN